MRLAGQEVPSRPKEPSEETRLLRARLILEEAFETLSKGLGVGICFDPRVASKEWRTSNLLFACISPFNMVETIDGCCDLKVVTTGTLSACGIHDMNPQIEVDNNNLAKFGPGGYRREDGKWIKPTGHKAPDLQSIIDLQEEL